VIAVPATKDDWALPTRDDTKIGKSQAAPILTCFWLAGLTRCLGSRMKVRCQSCRL